MQQLGVRVVTNDRTQIAPLELDLWLPDCRLGIEYNGLYWHGELLNGKQARQRLVEKARRCQEAGIRLVVIMEDEWTLKPEACQGYLRAILGLRDRVVGARKCRVVQDPAGARAFMNQYHLQGAAKGEHWGLLDPAGELVACMTWGRPNASRARTAQEGLWELVRFCVAPGVSVPGGASRLLGGFLDRHPDCTRVLSYSDNRWSHGALYRRLGFRRETQGQPGYWYFPQGSSGPRHHRYAFRKQRCLELFGGPATSTEWELMSRNGWDRIWDLGASRWVLDIPASS